MSSNYNEIAERRLEKLINSLDTVQEKFVYYILAIDAACIGFSVNLTHGSVLSLKEISLGCAVICWGYSFYCGVFQIQNREVAISLNIAMFKCWLKGEKAPESLENQIKERSLNGMKFRKKQNLYLLIGGVFFIIWHIFIMISNTKN